MLAPSALPLPLVAEAAGPLVRLVGVGGWVRREGLGPCGTCGGTAWALVTWQARVGGQVIRREALRCQKCLPADGRKSERLVLGIRMPERKGEV